MGELILISTYLPWLRHQIERFLPLSQKQAPMPCGLTMSLHTPTVLAGTDLG